MRFRVGHMFRAKIGKKRELGSERGESLKAGVGTRTLQGWFRVRAWG